MQPERRTLRLRSTFDASRIAGGTYYAMSSDPAYNQLRALALRGRGRIVSERDVGPGVKEVAVDVVASRSAGLAVRPNATEQMDIDPEYFQTVKREYSDWPEKWWREVVQNAVDAGAKSISLGYVKNDDGTRTVWCEDDGGGMPLEILRTKFLRFGATTKRGEAGAAGGFGKAKELIMLPWISWSVWSQAHVANGRANRYEVSDAPRFLRGTRVEAVMASDDCTTDLAAKSFLAKCHLPGIRITVNGEPVKASMRTSGDKVLDLGGDKAEVYFTRGKVFDGSHYFVRVKGSRGSLYTFAGYLPDDVGGSVIVEIVKPSIDILTANRDGFSDWRVRRQMEQFLASLAADVSSALRQKKGLIREKFKGEGRFDVPEAERAEGDVLARIKPMKKSAKKKNDGADEIFKVDEDSLSEALEVVSDYVREREQRVTSSSGEESTAAVTEAIGSTSTAAAAEMMRSVDFGGQNHLEAAIAQLVWRPDFYIVNQVEGLRVPKRFYPATMTPRVLHLARVWTELCRYVLIQLGERERYGVGFIFADDAAAAHLYDDGHWLMLNPFVSATDRTDIWMPNTTEHLKMLYAFAVHECTHMCGASTHNEVFAAKMTRNMAKCADGWKRIRQIVASIRVRGEAGAKDGNEQSKRPTKTGPSGPRNALPPRGPYEGYWLAEVLGGQVLDLYRDTTGGFPLSASLNAQTWKEEILRWGRSVYGRSTQGNLTILRDATPEDQADSSVEIISGYSARADGPWARVESPWERDRRLVRAVDRRLPAKGPYKGYVVASYRTAGLTSAVDVDRFDPRGDYYAEYADLAAWRDSIERTRGDYPDVLYRVLRPARINEEPDEDLTRFGFDWAGNMVRVDLPWEPRPEAPADGTEALPAVGPYPYYRIEAYRGDELVAQEDYSYAVSSPLDSLADRAEWSKTLAQVQYEHADAVVVVTVPSSLPDSPTAYETPSGMMRRPIARWVGGTRG
jgi:hypothetical protein